MKRTASEAALEGSCCEGDIEGGCSGLVGRPLGVLAIGLRNLSVFFLLMVAALLIVG